MDTILIKEQDTMQESPILSRGHNNNNIIIIIHDQPAGSAHSPKVLAKASCSLQLLGKHFVFPNIVVGNGAPGKLHGVFEMDHLTDLINHNILSKLMPITYS